MKRNIRLFLCLCALVFAAAVSAQTMKYQDLYKVKKKDTIYGIAKKYNITIDGRQAWYTGSASGTHTACAACTATCSAGGKEEQFGCAHWRHVASAQCGWRRTTYGGVLSWHTDGLR